MTLAEHVQQHAGARIEAHSEHEAVVIHTRAPSRILHALITASTCGLWLLAWIWIETVQRSHRVSFQVDAYGNIWKST
jgi:hypothetical protein